MHAHMRAHTLKEAWCDNYTLILNQTPDQILLFTSCVSLEKSASISGLQFLSL